MQGTRIVTGIVLLSLATVGCRAKFTHKNPQVQPSASADVGGPTPAAPVAPGGPSLPSRPRGPAIPTYQPAQPAEPAVPAAPGGYVPQVQVPPHGGPHPHPATPQLGCPTSDDGSVDPRRVIQKKTITFKRGRQMVWRKNCEGIVYSKRYEDLGSNFGSSQLVRIPSSGRGGSVMIFNRTTCDTPDIHAMQIQPSRDGSLTIRVATQPSSGTLLVKPGKNLIDYEIPGGEKGTLILTVKMDTREGDCIVLNDRGCEPRKREAQWTDTVFTGAN